MSSSVNYDKLLKLCTQAVNNAVSALVAYPTPCRDSLPDFDVFRLRVGVQFTVRINIANKHISRQDKSLAKLVNLPSLMDPAL